MFTKKTKAQYDNEIALLKHEIEDLRQIIKTQELLKLRAENQRLKEKEQLISKVKFNLQDVAYLQEEDAILVKYKVPFIKVFFDEKNEIIKNDMFYAINKLQLISFDDMKKIQTLINEIKENKNNT